jgi:hypothetical protein
MELNESKEIGSLRREKDSITAVLEDGIREERFRRARLSTSGLARDWRSVRKLRIGFTDSELFSCSLPICTMGCSGMSDWNS